jgi:carboxyl-terminal processing protease
MDRDSVLRDNRNRWHESLSKDIYMEEALNVLKDLLTRQNDLSLLRE